MKSSFLHKIAITIALIGFFSVASLAGNGDDKVEMVIKSVSSIPGGSESPSWEFESDISAIIDSYSSFIFRTKKSQEIDRVTFLINVDSFGKISGFELIGQEDRGLRERLDYVVRQLPKCKPIVGHTSLKPETFEISIKK